MSYENTKCPCGGLKSPQTMICRECEQAFKDHEAMRAFNSRKLRWDLRRNAAITVLTLSRTRKRNAFVTGLQINQNVSAAAPVGQR